MLDTFGWCISGSKYAITVFFQMEGTERQIRQGITQGQEEEVWRWRSCLCSSTETVWSVDIPHRFCQTQTVSSFYSSIIQPSTCSIYTYFYRTKSNFELQCEMPPQENSDWMMQAFHWTNNPNHKIQANQSMSNGRKQIRKSVHDDVIDSMLMRNLSNMSEVKDDEEELFGRLVAATLPVSLLRFIFV